MYRAKKKQGQGQYFDNLPMDWSLTTVFLSVPASTKQYKTVQHHSTMQYNVQR